MAISAHWDPNADSVGSPRAPRRKLRLEARGALPSGASGDILVHDISTSGLLIESALPLALEEAITIDLPHSGEVPALVVWASGKLFGCRFATPISSATLSAAQLRSAVSQPLDIAQPAPRVRDASFGARLQRLRKALGVSQTHIAARMGVSKPTVWAWEHDKARPVGSRMRDLADLLGVTPADLTAEPGVADGDEAIARSRETIATAFGIAPDRVRIWVEL